MEEWRNIEGYDDYQVSNYGRIKSLLYGKERILKPVKNGGYLRVGLTKNGERKWFRIHRIVAQTFLSNPYNLPQVNHKDENPSNNHVENLEWVSAKYNINYGTRNERVSKTMTNGKLSKTVYQYTLNGEFIAEYSSTMEVERQLGFANTHIGKCCIGQRKSAYGYKWTY